MAPVSQTFDLDHSLHFKSGETSPIGHLVSFSLAGSALTSDLQVVDPTDGKTAKIVGVLETIDWKGGRADPIRLQAYVSTGNQKSLAGLLDNPQSLTSAALNFAAYSYDHITNRYFETFAPTETPLNSLIEGADSKPAIQLDSTPVGNPPMLAFSLSIVPPSEPSQVLLVAARPDAKTAQSWGA